MIGQIFDLLFLGPVANLLVVIYHAFAGLGVVGATGFAIIILSVLIRLIVWPFMNAQLKSAKKMAELRPHLDHLKAKHKEDKQALAAAQMALYKEHGVNPAGGCLPALIQFPVIIALYQSILSFFNGQAGLDRINHLLYNPAWKLTTPPDLHFLGLNLATKPSEFQTLGFGLLLIPVVTGLLQFAQSKMMSVTPPPVQTETTKKAKKSESVKSESTEDTMAAMQSQMVYMMPAMIAIFAFNFPIGLALYWNVFTILGIIQQYSISGWGGLEPWLKR